MSTYYIWTLGCQMNKADSTALAELLCQLGYSESVRPEDADIMVVNSCAVRQSAEDRALNKLVNLIPLKRKRPDTVIALMGCVVAPDSEALRQSLPKVDFFLRPRQFDELIDYAATHVQPPLGKRDIDYGPTAYVPIIHGCNNFCSYCIVPYRRGREKSRPLAEIVAEVEALVFRGVKEVTLLGQNVDSYGNDLSDSVDLSDILAELNQIDGLARIRFLTSHPKDMSPKIIRAVASLDKVCEHINLPVQSGDDDLLTAMRRGYCIENYIDLIRRVRAEIPGVSLANDIIVGFPGETTGQFARTLAFLEEFRFDVVHVAAYSPREGTEAARKLPDDVLPEEKKRRLQSVEALQEQVSQEINSNLVGQTMEVLVDGKKGGRWQSRTRTDKLVFFDSADDCFGRLVEVKIESAGPWSLKGTVISVKD